MGKNSIGTLTSSSAASVREPNAASLLEAAAQAHATGDLDRTRQLCLRVLERDPHNGDALHLLALEEYSAGRAPQALSMLRRALVIMPSSAQVHANYAAILRAEGDLTAAKAAANKAVTLDPTLVAASNNLGLVLMDLAELDGAAAAFRRAIARAPRSASLHLNLGLTLRKQKHHKQALLALEEACRLDPALPEAFCELGVARYDAHLEVEAIEAFQRALQLRPQWPRVLAWLATALQDLRRPAEALPYAERCVALDPATPEFRFGLAMIQLQLGNFSQGWRNFEARHGMDSLAPRKRSESQWQGQPLRGARILLHAEQGLGDSLQFLRYAPLVADAGGIVVLDLPRRLHRLAASLPRVAEITAGFQLAAPCQWHCPLMSLPLAFGTQLATIPAQMPYLHPSAPALAEAEALPWPLEGLRVGLVCAGNPEHTHDRLRSIALEKLAPVLSLQGAHFFSLQLGADVAELSHYGVHNLAPQSGDMDDTAARMAQLDLLLTVDTAAAHLAGAMGLPCWMLDRYAGDARWLLDRSDSPWYPTMTLYRQSKYGDWDTVIERVRCDLEARMEALPVPRKHSASAQG